MFDCFFNDTATTEIYTYGHTSSLHDALPIYLHRPGRRSGGIARRVAEALDEPGGARSALLFLSPASLGRCGCADHASHFHAASRAGAPLFHISDGSAYGIADAGADHWNDGQWRNAVVGKRCVPFSAIGIPEAGVRCHAGMDAFPAQQGSDPAGHSAVRRADGFRRLSVDAPARSWPAGYFLFRLAFGHAAGGHVRALDRGSGRDGQHRACRGLSLLYSSDAPQTYLAVGDGGW